MERPQDVASALGLIPGWAGQDALLALAQLASPWFVGTLAASAVLFALLVLWRRSGASAAV